MSETLFPAMDKDFGPRPRTPIAATADPETSHLAAKEITESGLRDRQAGEVLAALKRYGPGTSAEVARLSGLERHVVGRRLPELEAAGFAVRRPARQCLVGQRMALTWKAV